MNGTRELRLQVPLLPGRIMSCKHCTVSARDEILHVNVPLQSHIVTYWKAEGVRSQIYLYTSIPVSPPYVSLVEERILVLPCDCELPGQATNLTEWALYPEIVPRSSVC